MTAVRTYEYDTRPFDPGVARAVSGLDYLRGILSGDYPGAPIASTLGFAPTAFDRGFALFEGTPERAFYNPIGVVHGGWAATLLDSAMGCAVQTMLPAGKAYTTVDLSVSFVRALTETTGRVRCEARIVHTGGTIATAEARVLDANGTLYAHGTSTCLVLSPK
jgi:uncharacterized protein (TIGR00369 family)